jgi:hypothetical protein
MVGAPQNGRREKRCSILGFLNGFVLTASTNLMQVLLLSPPTTYLNVEAKSVTVHPFITDFFKLWPGTLLWAIPT